MTQKELQYTSRRIAEQAEKKADVVDFVDFVRSEAHLGRCYCLACEERCYTVAEARSACPEGSRPGTAHAVMQTAFAALQLAEARS